MHCLNILGLEMNAPHADDPYTAAKTACFLSQVHIMIALSLRLISFRIKKA